MKPRKIRKRGSSFQVLNEPSDLIIRFMVQCCAVIEDKLLKAWKEFTCYGLQPSFVSAEFEPPLNAASEKAMTDKQSQTSDENDENCGKSGLTNRRTNRYHRND